MYTDGRHLRFTFIIVLAVLNSIMAPGFFVLLDRGVLSAAYLPMGIWTAVLPLLIAAVIPVVVGSYGLYFRKMWGLGFFTLGSGAVLFGSLTGLVLSARNDDFGILFFLSAYLILYNIIANIYTWIFRFNLKDF